jgi:hypothetical protein
MSHVEILERIRNEQMIYMEMGSEQTKELSP